MKSTFKRIICPVLTIIMTALSISLSSCSDNDPEVRTESDLVGVWSDSTNHYLYIQSDTRIYSLFIEEYDGETVGVLEPDGYIYEPGYNFIVYMGREGEPNVYQLMSVSETEMVWCWADNLLDEKYDGMSKSEILGALLKEADKGFTLDPSRTITYRRVPDSEFQSLLDKYGLEI
ncbi:MAG: hypothetical protein K2G52_10555 [Muribaculaceae bacterium]|nr:hypothetical protein [Muribaculaceae bacterium]